MLSTTILGKRTTPLSDTLDIDKDKPTSRYKDRYVRISASEYKISLNNSKRSGIIKSAKIYRSI
jgi:hypothetical protein